MSTISTGDFVKQVAEATGLTQVQVKNVLGAAGEQLKANLKKGQGMHFMGYMNFDVKSVPAKTGINPFTKQKVKYPAHKVPTCKLSSALKQLLKK